MNDDRVIGIAKNLGGKAQEAFGNVTGDTKSQVEGVINQAGLLVAWVGAIGRPHSDREVQVGGVA